MIELTRHEVNGVTLAVSSRRPERPLHPPLVLVPGTGNTAGDWETVATTLSHDRVVHAVDLRGHGRSEWPATYSIELMAQDLAGLLPMLGSEVDLVGHSLGGLVACRVLAIDSGNVRKLVLEDVGVPHPRTPLTRTRPAGELDFDWAVVEQVRPEIDAPASHWPLTLARIEVPTLVIGGGAPSFVPQEDVAELAEILTDARLTTITAGHAVHTAKPEEFTNVVVDFLDA